MIEKMNVRDNKKCSELNIVDECKSIIANCECGITEKIYLIDLSKMRKWEIMEVIGNYLDPMEKEVEWWEIKRLSTFCKAFEFSENRVAEFYARAVCEEGYSIAYAVTEDIILVLE